MSFWQKRFLENRQVTLSSIRESGRFFAALPAPWRLLSIFSLCFEVVLFLLTFSFLGKVIDGLIGARGIGVVVGKVAAWPWWWLVVAVSAWILVQMFFSQFDAKSRKILGNIRFLGHFLALSILLLVLDISLLVFLGFVALFFLAMFRFQDRRIQWGLSIGTSILLGVITVFLMQDLLHYVALRVLTVGEGMSALFFLLFFFLILVRMIIVVVRRPYEVHR